MLADHAVTPEELERIRSSVLAVRRSWSAPTKVRISEFAEAEIVVASGPLAGTRWRNDYAPYQAGIMDAFHEDGVQFVVVKGSSQFGKTAIVVVVVGYHIQHEPSRILVVQPTVDPMARDFARNRLEPTIEASPGLRAVVSRRRKKGASTGLLEKTFTRGALAIAGANSAASLASRDVRVLVLDEVDRYKRSLGNEGSPMAIALKRTTAYGDRQRVLIVSSPTIPGAPIDEWHKKGDQRRFYVPCPACGVLHPFMWSQVRWNQETRDPASARIHCPACDYGITDGERVSILARGQWRAEKPDREDTSIVSFHIWEAYSPVSTLAKIVRGFLLAREKQKAGDASDMDTWQNTTLGETHEIGIAEVVAAESLLLRTGRDWPPDVEVPAGAVCLTMGVDTQDNRLECLVVAWGPGEESWFVDKLIIPGDTSQPEPWANLLEAVGRQYRHETGHLLSIRSTCIDSGGHRTSEVYEFVKKHEKLGIRAIIGRGGQKPIVSTPKKQRWGRKRRPVLLYTVGVDAAKKAWATRLALPPPDEDTRGGSAGRVHFPAADWCDKDFLDQLVSEREIVTMRSGVPVTKWKKVGGGPNEGLDCAVYALAALRLFDPKLVAMAQRLATLPVARPAPTAGAAVADTAATVRAKRKRPTRRSSRSPYVQ